jgi:hypothetical protein
MFNPDDTDTIIQIKGSGPLALGVSLQIINGSKSNSNPVGSAKANI